MFSARMLCIASLCLSAQGAQALGTGDIAFTAFNADEDGWAIVALTDLAANSTIHFTDSNWDGAAFTSAEGFHTWQTGAAVIAAGTVIRFSDIDQAGRAVSMGSLSSTGNAALSSTADTLYAYVGSGASTPTTFLAAVSSEAAVAAATALGAAGLTAGVNAIALPASTDYASYSGTRSGAADHASYRALVNDAANWTAFTDGAHADAVPDTTAFAVSAVPEASTALMMMAGIGVLGLFRRR
ncbi:MAG: PEP-CTERM sorting domain-containing protein [Methyloversatilis sp.]|nr:PEP-CTERM sorting domain-containing protein [Methyloversatilis sp.]